MGKNAASKSGFHGLFNRKTLFVFSLAVVLLISSLFVYIRIVGTNSVVRNEFELTLAANDALPWMPVTITLNSDVTLTESLVIPANKKITLRSDSSEFYRLNGADNCYTIVVENSGVLTLDGIIVTHKSKTYGSGVRVYSGGTFIVYSGEISGNRACRIGDAYDDGGGVYNDGVFKMLGGEISGNDATLYGGGVYNRGTFKMSGGKISNNIAGPHAVRYSGSGGGISGGGGGVYNNGMFIMSGGEISNNTSAYGGGVYNNGGDNAGIFELSGGKIFSNTAVSGNVYYNSDSRGSTSYGGGVYNIGSFSMSGGTIFNNRVLSGVVEGCYGGGVCNMLYWGGTFELVGGMISGNTSSSMGNDDVYTFGE
jgi:hypothetical protein